LFSYVFLVCFVKKFLKCDNIWHFVSDDLVYLL